MISNATSMNCDTASYARHSINQAARLTWELHTPEQLPGVQDLVISAMEHLAYLPRDQYAVLMGLEEAVFNAFQHGNGMCPSKRVHVSATICDEKVLVQVEDEGAGFAVDEVPDPTLPENLLRPDGRGIYMMKAFLDSVEYQPPGNVVAFSKIRSQSL